MPAPACLQPRCAAGDDQLQTVTGGARWCVGPIGSSSGHRPHPHLQCGAGCGGHLYVLPSYLLHCVHAPAFAPHTQYHAFWQHAGHSRHPASTVILTHVCPAAPTFGFRVRSVRGNASTAKGVGPDRCVFPVSCTCPCTQQ